MRSLCLGGLCVSWDHWEGLGFGGSSLWQPACQGFLQGSLPGCEGGFRIKFSLSVGLRVQDLREPRDSKTP